MAHFLELWLPDGVLHLSDQQHMPHSHHTVIDAIVDGMHSEQHLSSEAEQDCQALRSDYHRPIMRISSASFHAANDTDIWNLSQQVVWSDAVSADITSGRARIADLTLVHLLCWRGDGH